MINRIKDHVNSVLSKGDFDRDFKNEMIHACVSEYEEARSDGLSQEDAYHYAIKDFDNEYCRRLYDPEAERKNKLLGHISFYISLLFVGIFTACNQFMAADAFIWSVWVFAIPNAIILFIKMLIVVLRRKFDIIYEVKGLLFSALLYVPFILIELAGNKADVVNYLITFPVNILFLMIYRLIKTKHIDLVAMASVTIAVAVLINYFMLYSNAYLLELIVKWVSFLSVSLISILSLVNRKLKLKEILISLGFISILLAAISIADNKIQVYDTFTLVSLLFSFLLIVQLLLKNKCRIISNYSFLANAFMIFASVFVFYRDIYSTAVVGLHYTVNYQSLLCVSMFLFLMLLQKDTCSKGTF